MFCQQCGTAMAAVATACPSCNTRPAAAGRALRSETVKAAWSGALRTLRVFAPDPVGRLPGAFQSLGEVEGLRVGLVYGALSLACLLLGGYWPRSTTSSSTSSASAARSRRSRSPRCPS